MQLFSSPEDPTVCLHFSNVTRYRTNPQHLRYISSLKGLRIQPDRGREEIREPSSSSDRQAMRRGLTAAGTSPPSVLRRTSTAAAPLPQKKAEVDRRSGRAGRQHPVQRKKKPLPIRAQFHGPAVVIAARLSATINGRENEAGLAPQGVWCADTGVCVYEKRRRLWRQRLAYLSVEGKRRPGVL